MGLGLRPWLCSHLREKAESVEEAIVEDHAIVTLVTSMETSIYLEMPKSFANAVTGGTPVIMEKASVYGELGGEIEVHEHAVILPGVVIDNPTIDVPHPTR